MQDRSGKTLSHPNGYIQRPVTVQYFLAMIDKIPKTRFIDLGQKICCFSSIIFQFGQTVAGRINKRPGFGEHLIQL